MDITAIVVEEFVEVDVDERLAKVRAKFDRANPKGVIVTDDGEFAGVIGESELVKSRIKDTKASVLMTSAPRVDHTEDIREVARLLVEGDVSVAPVFRGDVLEGIITVDAILQAVLENLDALTVSQIYSDDVIRITTAATVGQAINQLREHGISRLPIVDADSDRLAGVITTHDIVSFVVRDHERQHKGDRSGDRDRMLDLPVENLMTSPVLTVGPDETVKTAVERMFEREISGLIVVEGEGDETVAGVLTKTDVLRALTFTEEESMDVQITNVDLLDSIDRSEIVASITQVVDKYQQMNVIHAHVRFHEHKEKLRGTPLIQSQIRLRTSHGQLAGSGEGYGANHAFHVALDKLERNLLELKGINADEEYRGQLLRKLNEI